jgi:hypothetical protein
MPHFTLRFIGMSVFARFPGDEKIEVRFVMNDAAPAGHAGHQANEHEKHVPVLLMSPDSWAHTTDDGSFNGRAPGRPFYLSQYTSVEIHLNGAPLPGRVVVSDGGAPKAKPATAAEWDNFEHLIPKLDDLYPGSTYSKTRADNVAPNGVITLTGGKLGSDVPSNAGGEGPWDVSDPTDTTSKERFLSDVAKYSFEFGPKDTVQIVLTRSPEKKTTLDFRPNTDIAGWLAHEPFLTALNPPAGGTIRHLALSAAFMEPVPNSSKTPPIITTKPRVKTGAQKDHPDDQSCPPLQARVS